MIIAISGKKGGTKKSTTAWTLAAGFQKRDTEVVVVDADDNATCVKKGSSREQLHMQGLENNDKVLVEQTKPILVVPVSHEDDIRLKIKELSEKYPVVIIDFGGYESWAAKSALPVVDHIILPTGVSQDDIDQIPPFVEWLITKQKETQINNPEYFINLTVFITGYRHFYYEERKNLIQQLEIYDDFLTVSVANFKEKKLAQQLSPSGLTYFDVNEPERSTFEILMDEILGNRRLCKPSEVGKGA